MSQLQKVLKTFKMQSDATLLLLLYHSIVDILIVLYTISKLITLQHNAWRQEVVHLPYMHNAEIYNYLHMCAVNNATLIDHHLKSVYN